MSKMTSNQVMFAHYERSLINGRNLANCAEKYAVRKAEKALAAVVAEPTHSYAQLSDARLALADARLALFRAERHRDPSYEERCAMYEGS